MQIFCSLCFTKSEYFLINVYFTYLTLRCLRITNTFEFSPFSSTKPEADADHGAGLRDVRLPERPPPRNGVRRLPALREPGWDERTFDTAPLHNERRRLKFAFLPTQLQTSHLGISIKYSEKGVMYVGCP